VYRYLKSILTLCGGVVLLGSPELGYAEDTAANATVKPVLQQQTSSQKNPVANRADTDKAASLTSPLNITTTSPVLARVKQEEAITPNSFVIAFYKPTYIMPYYYTGSVYNRIYDNETPNDEKLKNNELKFQLSFKVPLWKDIAKLPSSLYLGYTQMSYWQAYDHDPFFRSTDYEPELFLANELNWHLIGNWQLNFANVGVVLQSNGFGGKLERSWNRIYFSAITSTDNWVIAARPWIILRDNTYERQNPDMGKYMGYGVITLAYKFHKQAFTLETHNFIESGGRRAGTTVSWSFPLTQYINGYVQVFSGYGQSLIEYNHRTTSAGVGISLSNWV
jgi:phospholipase A1